MRGEHSGTRLTPRRRCPSSALRLPDALVIAIAIALNADHLLTTDRRWATLRGIGLGRRVTVVG
jgi:predicted nucleic acid-binding protein